MNDETDNWDLQGDTTDAYVTGWPDTPEYVTRNRPPSEPSMTTDWGGMFTSLLTGAGAVMNVRNQYELDNINRQRAQQGQRPLRPRDIGYADAGQGRYDVPNVASETKNVISLAVLGVGLLGALYFMTRK